VNRLLVLVVVACPLTCVSCGDIFVRGAINPGSQSASGMVSVVQFSAATRSGVSLTIVTLAGDGMAGTFSFCGDQRALFPIDSQVRVRFMPGDPCASLVAVALG
jgi:hypothetical protein